MMRKKYGKEQGKMCENYLKLRTKKWKRKNDLVGV